MKTTFPLVSIVVPTYNSGKTLKNLLNSIVMQKYPKNKIETLVVDGGSQDNTVAIARKYNCRIIKNDKKLQVYGKHIGFLKAKGRYVVHYDSDEIINNPESIKLKIDAFKKNKNIVSVISSGMIKSRKSSKLNCITNEFGDPFTYFMHRNETSFRFLEKRMRKYGKKINEDENCIVFKFDKYKPTYFELSTMGSVVDKKYLHENVRDIGNKPYIISHIFYILLNKEVNIGFLKNDVVVHNSVQKPSDYIAKINSRVINNVFANDMGMSAFSGIIDYYPTYYRYKKYLYIPYTLSLVFPVFDSLYLAITRKNTIFLIMPFINFYIVFLVIYYSILKFTNYSPTNIGWGK